MAQYTVRLTAPAGNYPFKKVRVTLTCNNLNEQHTQTFTFQPMVLVKQHVFDLANDTWDLEIVGTGFVPIEQPNIIVNADMNNDINLTVLYYTLHTDRDRDGDVDATPGIINRTSPPAITYGLLGVGAIIPVNCNRDGGNTDIAYTDSQDDHVNGNTDLGSGTARLKVKKNRLGPDVAPSPNWWVVLLIDAIEPDLQANRHFRIFDSALDNSQEIIGPSTGVEANVQANTIGDSRTFAIEALRFAGRGFESGKAKIMLCMIQPEVAGYNTAVYQYTEQVVAARWIGNHHRQTVTRMYAAEASNPDNTNFLTALDTAAGNNNPAVTLTRGQPEAANPVKVPFLAAQGWDFVQAYDYNPLLNRTVLANTVATGADVWMRDTIVSGHSAWPGNVSNTPQFKHVFMKAHRWRPLQNWVYRTLLSDSVGVSYPAAGSEDEVTSANSGGNIAVTPPVQKTSNGVVTQYPYGRFYYGHNHYHVVDPSSRAFMAAQNLQPPITLDTDWLGVGHVDEMMTFIPDNNPASAFKKWKLLVASPAEAYRVMRTAQGANGASRLLNRAVWNGAHNRFDYTSLRINGINVGATINDFLGNGQALLTNPRDNSHYTYQQLRDWNIGGVETVITRNITTLKNAFDLVDADIIKVPVIFFPDDFKDGDFTFADKISGWTIGRDNGFNVYPGKQGGFQCGALTGDMPNMFVGNDRLMIPKPFGPWIEDNTNPNHGYDLFERDLTQKIAAIVGGPTCDFIDDWDIYHMYCGEIHCGTNELRTPYNGQAAFGNARYANWWTAVDA